MFTKKTISSLFLFFVQWRFALFAIGLFFVPLTSSFQVLSNFDGIKYIQLAKNGYGTPDTYYSYNLFPLYPTLINYFSEYFGFLNSGILLSTIFALISIFLLYYLISLDYDEEATKLGITLLLLFPGSFFLNAVYSESLFLALSLATLVSLRHSNLLLAVVFASLASYTRAVGIVLWLVIILEHLDTIKWQIRKLLNPKTLLLIVPSLGFFSYLKYLEINTNSFMRFLPSIPTKFVFIHQVFIRYFKMVTFVDHDNYLFIVILTEFLIGLVALYLLIFKFKSIRLSYWIYLLIFFFIPSLWGSFTSISRFMLICPPFFIALTDLLSQNQKLKNFFITASTVLLITNMVFFIKGLFVG